jgi:CheY-like chemotaxis protein
MVLVVDDDPEITETIREVIESQGCRAVVASNGREALATLDREKPSLLLIDLFMPVMNGVELLKAIKKSPKLASIPRVIMTGANDIMIGVREDVSVLYKPINYEALTRLLTTYCRPVTHPQ